MNKTRRPRPRLLRREGRGIGTSPHMVEPPRQSAATGITWHVYGPEAYAAHAAPPGRADGQLLWIDICGMRNAAAIAEIATDCGLSDLAIAELFHLDQRVKTDLDGDLVVTVLRMPEAATRFATRQITLVLGSDFVLSLREGPHVDFEGVYRRLAKGGGPIRGSSGYLFYALIDTVIDSYYPVLETCGGTLDALEDRILHTRAGSAMQDIHLAKRDLLHIRHALWPLRDALVALQRADRRQVDPSVLPYLQDCADHAFQLLEVAEVYRGTAQSLVEMQMSALSQRTNEVMKVLTMIATAFIPMTFVTGLYGMNFDRSSPYNLPELGWPFGYFFALGLMGLSAAATVFLFWRLGWILAPDLQADRTAQTPENETTRRAAE